MPEYVQPERGKESFTCPHCGVYSQYMLYADNATLQYGGQYDKRTEIFPISTSICTHCKEYIIWHNKQRLYPVTGDAPLPNPDMPEDVKRDYLEASSISRLSPKGAAALLRLAIQKLCVHLGGRGKNINDDIGSLVKQGLPLKVQQALDVVTHGPARQTASRRDETVLNDLVEDAIHVTLRLVVHHADVALAPDQAAFDRDTVIKCGVLFVLREA